MENPTSAKRAIRAFVVIADIFGDEIASKAFRRLNVQSRANEYVEEILEYLQDESASKVREDMKIDADDENEDMIPWWSREIKAVLVSLGLEASESEFEDFLKDYDPDARLAALQLALAQHALHDDQISSDPFWQVMRFEPVRIILYDLFEGSIEDEKDIPPYLPVDKMGDSINIFEYFD